MISTLIIIMFKHWSIPLQMRKSFNYDYSFNSYSNFDFKSNPMSNPSLNLTLHLKIKFNLKISLKNYEYL
jgi:hypothetical protein